MSLLKYTICFLLLIVSLHVRSQLDIAIGGWKSHLPYQNGRKITQSDEKIIYATEWSLVIIDKEERSYEFLSKTDGLSDIGISEIKYDSYNEQLIIAYSNSNIDILKNGEVFNLPNIKESQVISGDRRIYKIHVADQDHAYFATGFGLVELDLMEYNFGSTTFTEFAVNDVATLGDLLLIATPEGIYSANRDGSVNLVDFNNWEFLGQEYQLPLLYNSEHVEIYSNYIYASVDGDLWKGGTSEPFEKILEVELPFRIEFLSAEGSRLMCGLRDDDRTSQVLFFDGEGQYELNGQFCVERVLYALEDQFNQIWYADDFSDFRMSDGISEDCTRIKFNSPFSHLTRDITVRDNVVYCASGGVTENYNVLSNRLGIYILDDGQWMNINQSSYPEIADHDLLNFINILPHPSKNLVYSGTYWGGLMEWNENDHAIRVFDQNNSSIGGVTGDEQRERVTGLAFDEDENLWISNFLASKPVSVFTRDETWHSFSVISDRQLTELIVDEFGFKWFVVFGNRGGILIYDSGERIEDPTDDRQKFINSSNSELTTNLIHAIALDLNGSVWVGTSEGPVVFDCGTEVFSADCRGRRIRVLQDSIPSFLLSDVEIREIEVDGANRKWFGTRNGLFVQSPDGENEEYRFTVENSPLFDNNVIDLGYNELSGEMLIATDKGIQAYRTSATTAGRRHSPDVYAFPNPVHPEYSGPITIKGLARDANVKITDMNGIIVFETQALGGQAIWDGTDFNGRRAQTGVYLVFSSTTGQFTDPDSFVTKVLFIR